MTPSSRSADGQSGRAEGEQPEGAARIPADARSATTQRRLGERKRRQAAQRAARIRNVGILVVIAAVIGGLVIWRSAGRRAAARQYTAAVRAAGCGQVQTFELGSNQDAWKHLEEGEVTTYPTSPPTGGKHDPAWLTAGIYNEPFSEERGPGSTIYKAVHNLEHGYVIVWHKDLSDAELDGLDNAFGNERKVIVVPYPRLEGARIALSAWERLQVCDRLSVKVVEGFIDTYREQRSAPEPNAA
ncbi:MAG: DUF3105 domain-containing protein [Actinomycetota bacterium]